MSDSVVRTIPCTLALFDEGLRLRHMTDAWWDASRPHAEADRREVLGRRADNLYASAFAQDPGLLEQYERACRGEEIHRPYESWLGDDGAVSVLQTTIRPWRDGAKVLGCCVMLDIQRRIEPSGPMSALFIAACRANQDRRAGRQASDARR